MSLSGCEKRICQDSAHMLIFVPNPALYSGGFVLGVSVLNGILTVSNRVEHCVLTDPVMVSEELGLKREIVTA